MQGMCVKNRVAEYRTRLGLTQNDLAKYANLGQSSISEIEEEKRLPRIDTALFISSVLKCEVGDIFYLDKVDRKENA